ncbi:MAG: hypothetical protein RRZ24_02300 [Clostridia bacterium]
MKKIACIDIGSNSIRTMTAERVDDSFAFSEKQVFTTRLAEGLVETNFLSKSRMEQSLGVIRQFANHCKDDGLPVYAYATSAVRDAVNRDAFSTEICAIIGDRLFILSGEQEACNAYLAATGNRGGMIDIGGGSTQIITPDFCHSYPLGCVRARDLSIEGTLEQIQSSLASTLNNVFSTLSNVSQPVWTGVGGTITTLCAYVLGLTVYDESIVQNAILTRNSLLKVLRQLSSLGDARARHPLLDHRHDVILQGGAILIYVMDCVQADQLRVSDADGLEGFAIRTFEGLQV